MEVTILSEKQKKLLRLLSKEKNICKNFYLSGGTALAEFYLKHRYSEDLDFFSENEFEPQDISTILKSIQEKADIKSIDYEQSFNRNLYFLRLEKETIKTEFTYFPFIRIEKKEKIGELFIDSFIDIAVNKIFTIYQKPRSRDFIDLYFIMQKTGWTIEDLAKKAKIKFDWHIDPIQLGSQLIKAKELKDYPRMITKISDNVWQDFFIEEAKKLDGEIF
ncbi:MAG: nucleotidyl transferase AbiEii/AbiGii toxin family protein [Candidatus Paceibacterota bacterium]|jgi:predicted nucleotidyltransferase component of viral defense system